MEPGRAMVVPIQDTEELLSQGVNYKR